MILDTLDIEQREKILRHLALVIEKNKTLNLTRIDTLEKGIPLHVEDSLLCLDEFSQQDGKFLDIGTGGGFPGIPLAIASGRSGVLIDSIKKKANAVQEMIDELGLNNQLSALGIRSEEYAEEVGESFDTVLFRAVSSLPVIEELATPLLKKDGLIIALRGKETTESLDEARRVAEKLGLELLTCRHTSLDDEYERNICVFKKSGESTISLPRRVGMAQKRPLH